MAATGALFDLFLRCHANLPGLPDPTELQVRLRAAGFARATVCALQPQAIVASLREAGG